MQFKNKNDKDKGLLVNPSNLNIDEIIKKKELLMSKTNIIVLIRFRYITEVAIKGEDSGKFEQLRS